MCRCMVDGMRAYFPVCSFEANLAYLTEDVLDLDTCIPKTLSWRQTLELWRLRVFLQYLPRLCPALTRWLGVASRRALARTAAKVWPGRAWS